MIKLEQMSNYYTQKDLIDFVYEKDDLNDFTKSTLSKFIEDISRQLIELGYQMNRQPMTLDIHKQYSDLNNTFAEVIFKLLDTEIYSENDIDKILGVFTSNVNLFTDSLCSCVPTYISIKVEQANDKIQSVVSKFSTEDNGLLDKEDNTISMNTNDNNNDNDSDFILNLSDILRKSNSNKPDSTEKHKRFKKYKIKYKR